MNRQHCRLTICIELVELTNNNTDTETRCLVYSGAQLECQKVLETYCKDAVYNVLSLHGWSEIKPAENDDVIYEEPLTVTMYVDCRCLLHIGNLVWFFKHYSFWRELGVSFAFGLHIHRDKRI